jgi:hypothetical protein
MTRMAEDPHPGPMASCYRIGTRRRARPHLPRSIQPPAPRRLTAKRDPRGRTTYPSEGMRPPGAILALGRGGLGTPKRTPEICGGRECPARRPPVPHPGALEHVKTVPKHATHYRGRPDGDCNNNGVTGPRYLGISRLLRCQYYTVRER